MKQLIEINMRLINKILIAIAICVFLTIACIYVFIPGELNISVVRLVACNSSAGFRHIGADGSGNLWWPAKGSREGSDAGARTDTCRIKAKSYPMVEVMLEDGVRSIPGKVAITTYHGRDSSAVLWTWVVPTGSGPIQRFLQYRLALALRKNTIRSIDSLQNFLDKMDNIYGMELRHAMSHDGALITTQWIAPSYPSTAEIYRHLDSIRAYISGQGARETNYPMLHVGRSGDGNFETMVGVPINKDLPKRGDFVPKRFIPWKVIEGQVNGGAARAEHAMEQLLQYTADHELTLMAIPFQSLVTDRRQEPDSTRWVTRVIVPVP
jgi:hypothetical protein